MSEDFPYGDIPGTPTEKRRSRLDAFNSPIQSPMIKISEEDDIYSVENTANFQPPTHSKPLSGHYNGGDSLYSLDINNSGSSLFLPGGNIAGNRSSMSSLKYVPPPAIPIRNKSPSRNRSPKRMSSPVRNRSSSPKKVSPFNFQSTNLSATPPASASRASHRKGHRYKHSSVSMNFFQEPKQRAPLKITAAFPIPTRKEILASCTSEQKWKLSWSLFHLLFSMITFLVGYKYSVHSFSTLSHLMFYDSLACCTVVFVDIMGNFDVWSKSSIKYPFGLGRIEVLFGFALSVSLIFVGCDLVSHLIEEFMISFMDSGTDNQQQQQQQHSHGHGHHDHDSNSPVIQIVLYELVIFTTIFITFWSTKLATSNKPKSAIPSMSFLKESILTNPTHIITLIFAIYLALNPLLLTLKFDIEINNVAILVVSVLICYMGWQVVKYLGYIVLLSFPRLNDKNDISINIKDSIESSDYFKSSYRIANLIVSQVHLNLVIVLINIKMIGGSDDDEVNLRHEVNELIKVVFKNVNVETTVDIDRL